MLYGSSERRQRRLGQGGQSVLIAVASAALLAALPPSTVTKLGQNPLTQEKSLLQLDWSIARLRPNSVSTRPTDRQFDVVEQSPQPSHTSR